MGGWFDKQSTALKIALCMVSGIVLVIVALIVLVFPVILAVKTGNAAWLCAWNIPIGAALGLWFYFEECDY